MTIVCTGGRDHKNPARVLEVLEDLQPSEVHVGDCPAGVDKFKRIMRKLKRRKTK